MEAIDKIVENFDKLVAGRGAVADIAALLDSMRERPAYLELLGAMSVNSLKVLDLDVLRQWPRQFLPVLSLFILRMQFIPLDDKYPCGRRELAIAEALQDGSVPKHTRAQLWRTFMMSGYIFPYYMESNTWNVPPVLYDHPAVRRWFCLTKQPGWEDMSCSDPYFFAGEMTSQFKSDEDKQALAAIQKDLPSALMMPLSIQGRELVVKYAKATMALCASRIATYLYNEGNKTFLRHFSPRKLLLYVCANWSDDKAVPFVIMLERDNPGLARNTLDALGHDALWYSLYQRKRFSPLGTAQPYSLGKALIELGCDPGRQYSLGLSYNDLV